MSNSEWKWTPSKLRLEDWDFRPEKLPDRDVEACFCYEFSREDAALRQAVSESRKRHPDYKEKYGHNALPQSAADALSQPILPLAYRTNPKWPEVPFRLLARRSNVPQAATSSGFYGVIPWTLEMLLRGYFGQERNPGKLKRKDWNPSPAGGLWRCSEQSDLVAFEIPWHWPDDVLKKGFAQWLKEHRPQRKTGDWRPIVEQTKQATGAAAKKRQYLSSLKALGAYRLLECYKGDRQRAKTRDGVAEALGKDFQHDSAWTEGRKRAEAVIAHIKELNKDSIAVEQFAGTSLLSRFASTQSGLEAK